MMHDTGEGFREATETATDGPPPSVARDLWREWVRPLLVILLVVTGFRSAVADWNDVPTGSMKPTILEGERIFVNKVAYDLRVPFTRLRLVSWDDPARGDVVILFSPADDKRLVKRVIGLPGDLVELRNNHLFVNGLEARYEPIDDRGMAELDFRPPTGVRLVEERLGKDDHPVLWAPFLTTGSSFAPVRIPQGSYFVMGDNRDRSRDSRWFGFVRRDRIVGRATTVVISLDPRHHYAPRWGRFFHSLE